EDGIRSHGAIDGHWISTPQAHALRPQSFIGRSPLPCNQPCPAITGEVVVSPLKSNLHTVFKLHDVEQVNEQPREPGQITRKLERADIGDGPVPADGGE